MYIILALLGTIAPLVGGLIATRLGMNTLYIIVIIGLTIVFVPLFKRGERHTRTRLDLKRVAIRDIWKDMVSYGGAGLEATASLVSWPLFAYLIVKTYESVGIISSIALIFTVVTTYFVGKKVNNANRHKFIKNSSLIDGILFSLFIFVDSFSQMVTLNLARTVANSLRSAPYISEYYLHADEYSRSEYIYYMESAIDLMKIVACAILFWSAFYFDIKIVLILGLLLGAVGGLMAGLMPRAKCELPYCEMKKKGIKVLPKLRSRHATD
jgi:hypothetical protein